MTKRLQLIVCGVLTGVLLILFTPGHPASSAVIQKINYTIEGDCVDYYEENGEYALFENEPDWTCYVVVKISPTKPVRSVSLQFWNGRKWLIESNAKTDTKGIAYLDFDPYTCDDSYCEGEYKYKVVTAAAAPQKINTSKTFYVSFYPEASEEEEYEMFP